MKLKEAPAPEVQALSLETARTSIDEAATLLKMFGSGLPCDKDARAMCRMLGSELAHASAIVERARLYFIGGGA